MKGYGLTFFIAVAAVLSAAVFVTTANGAFWYSADTEIPVPFEKITVRNIAPEDYPSRLRIPALGIDTHIQEVGVTASGNMASPSNFTDVGWYKYGTVPGFAGSAVMAGHLDNALALDGVFKELDTLQAGDDVYVEKLDGTTLHFRVTGIETYRYDSVPLTKLFSQKDKARLHLVTCGGVWLPEKRSYDERLIVYTKLVH